VPGPCRAAPVPYRVSESSSSQFPGTLTAHLHRKLCSENKRVEGNLHDFPMRNPVRSSRLRTFDSEATLPCAKPATGKVPQGTAAPHSPEFCPAKKAS